MLHIPNLILDLALILGAAAVVTLLFKKLKQPVVLGYILAGLLVGPHFHLFPTVVELESIRTWADIGVIFLLFSLGLEFSFKKLLKVGGSALIMAITGISMTMLLGYTLGKFLGWNSMDCLFLGGMLSIASTTIIIRAYDELNLKSKKFTQIVMGVLIIEDLVAVVLMVVLSTVAVTRSFEGAAMLSSVLKLGFFLVVWFISGIFFVPTLLRKLQKLMNEETLLIVALALCFLMVVLATYAGYSPALGAFIMGSVLAETTKAEKIESIIGPVKNLFGAIFFVSVGMLIDPDMVAKHGLPIAAATLVLLFAKPFFVSIGALISGQPLKIAVRSGMSLSQIGEFSFIIATLGMNLKVTSGFLYPIAVAVSVITAFTTPYMIRFSEHIHNALVKRLPIKLVYSLNSYSSNVQAIRNVGEWQGVLRSYGIVMTLNSIVVIGLTILSARFLSPFMQSKLDSPMVASILTALLTLIGAGPFLLGLTFKRVTRQAVHNLWLQRRNNRAPLIALEISRMFLAVFLVGFMFNALFSSIAALAVAIGGTVLIVLLFKKYLQLFYALLERRFISNFNARENGNGKPSAIDVLPWDAHLAEFEIESESVFSGKKLSELALREQYGINIAKIERGTIVINIPGKDDLLFPGDRISVIGTDEQLSQFKAVLDAVPADTGADNGSNEIVLQQFVIDAQSLLLGKSIRESGIREKTRGLIIGIERDGKRILNPDSLTVFEIGDLVWIAGEEGITARLGTSSA